MINLNQIHNDKRGEIYLLKGDLKEHEEITFFVTKKGFARGGCVHRINDELNVVLEGKICYFLGEKGEKKFPMEKGASLKIPKNTPHYFVAIEDSLVVEWGCEPEEKNEKYQPVRDIVDRINKKLNLNA